MRRCEHNCHLCKNEWLGRCFGSKHYGLDVSMEGNREENKKLNREWCDGDLPICEEYKYCGTDDHLREIELAKFLGLSYLDIKSENSCRICEGD